MPSPKTVMLGLAAAMTLQGVNAYRCARITTTVTVTVTSEPAGQTLHPVEDFVNPTKDADADTDSTTSAGSSAITSTADASSSATTTTSVVISSSTAVSSSAAASSSAADPTTDASSSTAASSTTASAASATTPATGSSSSNDGTAGVNLILNGDFEQTSASGAYDGKPAWSMRGKASVQSGDAGTHHLYLPVPGYDDYSQATQTVASIQDKHRYILKYRRKVTSSSDNYSDGHCFLIVSMGNTAIESYTLKKSNGWESHASPAITLRSTDKDLSFHVDCDGNSSGLDAYLDSISLVEAASS